MSEYCTNSASIASYSSFLIRDYGGKVQKLRFPNNREEKFKSAVDTVSIFNCSRLILSIEWSRLDIDLQCNLGDLVQYKVKFDVVNLHSHFSVKKMVNTWLSFYYSVLSQQGFKFSMVFRLYSFFVYIISSPSEKVESCIE